MKSRVLAAIMVGLMVPTVMLGVSTGAGAAAQAGGAHSAAAHAAASAASGCSSLARPKGHYIGLVAHDFPGSTTWITNFTDATHVRPNMIQYYTGFDQPFDPTVACQVIQGGALPVIQLQPWEKGEVAAIAAGQDNSFLASYADAIKAFGGPVALSFGHEMNGTWYPWGSGHVTPATFIAAWRAIHDAFTAASVTNVIWLWTVNKNETPPREWWPGRKYVTWVGIDGYYTHSKDTWNSTFKSTLKAVRKFTHKKVLIAETAVGPGPHRARQIRNLFAGMRRHKTMLGFIWFDIDRRRNWNLETSKSGVRAFRKKAPRYLRQRR
jgi:mannan endo-1,4-beta-mannosidase